MTAVPRERLQLATVGREVIDGKPAWHVRGTFKSQQRDYWIDESSFRIYKFTLTTQSDEHVVTSTYNDDASILPSYVHIIRVNDKKISGELALAVNKRSIGSKVDANMFTLASLDMPYMQSVEDKRAGLIFLGYWDGDALQKTHESFDLKSHKQSKDPLIWMLCISAFFILAIGAFILIRQKRSSK